MTRFFTIFAAALSLNAAVSAQYMLDGGVTQEVDSAWTTNGIVVGGTTAGNVLSITAGGHLTNTFSTIGEGPGAGLNAAGISGDASWVMSGDLTVGDEGSSNLFVIGSGAFVSNMNAYVGAATNALYNTVQVTGGEWMNTGTLQIGGEGNAVNITGGLVGADIVEISTNGGALNLSDATLSVGSDFDASAAGFNWNAGGHLEVGGALTGVPTNAANQAALVGGRAVTIRDGGSWTDSSSADLIIGQNDNNSFLVVEGGGYVVNQNAEIGGGSSAFNNEVVVRDAGSYWRNAGGSLAVGAGAGSNNGLTVTNGGWVYVGEASTNEVSAGTEGGIVAASTNGASFVTDNDAFTMTDGTLYLGGTADTNLTGTAVVQNGAVVEIADLKVNNAGSAFYLNEGGKLTLTDDLDVDSLGDGLVWENGGALEVQGTLTLDGGLEGDARTLTVSGEDAAWSIAGDMTVGTNGVVVFEDGASVTNTAGGINGKDNQVIVQGAGTQLLRPGTLTAAGEGNSLTVQSGGRVSASDINFTGDNQFNLNSAGTLQLTGSFDWSAVSNLNWNSGSLQVDGTLTGMETVTNTIVGNTNAVATIIDGSRDLTLNNGAWIDAGNDRIIGYNSSNSDVLITNGTRVVNLDGYIGWGSGAAGNRVTVSGTNSVWQNTGGDLYVGAYWKDGTNLVSTASPSGSAKNALFIGNGGRVFVGEATNSVFGMTVASTNGASFTVWDGQAYIDDTLSLGLSSNAYGSAVVTNGGLLRVGSLNIANTNSSLMLGQGGRFEVESGFDVLLDGFSWGSNSTLVVGGALTNMASELSMGRNLTLLGSNAYWNAAGEDLEIGLDGASKLELVGGAVLTNVNDIVIGAVGNTNNGAHSFDLYDGAKLYSQGSLWVGNTTSNNGMEMYSQSQAAFAGSVQLGGETAGNFVVVNGSNTVLTIGTDLLVGDGSTNSIGNALAIQNQGYVYVANDVVINSGNDIFMSGGATNTLGGNYTIQSNAAVTGSGTVVLEKNDAVLLLEDGNGVWLGNGAVSDGIVFEGSGNNIVQVNGGTFYVDGSNSNQYRNFETLQLTGASLNGYGTNDAFAVVNMIGGDIRPGGNLTAGGAGTLVIAGDLSASNTTYHAQLLGNSGSDLLHLAGGSAIDLSGLNASISVFQAPTNLQATILTADAGYGASEFAATNVVNKLLLFDVVLDYDGTKVDVVLTNNTERFSSSLDYAGTEAIRSGFNGMKNAVFTRTKQLRRNLVSTAHSMPHEAFLMTNTNGPAGPQGPGADNTIFDMHVWAQYFTGQGEYDEHGASYGYTLNNGGTTIGADKLIGEALTVGFNYTFTRADIRTTNNDSLDAETYWLGAYGEWVNNSGVFIDGLLAAGFSSYDSVRVENDGVLDYRGTASYRGNAVGTYLDVGQYMYYKNLSLAPYAGLHMLFSSTEDHTETEENGEVINVFGVDRNIVESALGLKGRHRFDTNAGRFQTTGFAEWTHDFVNDEIYSSMQAAGRYSVNTPVSDMAAIRPEADLFNVGLGFSWRNTEYLEIGIGYNGRFSKDYAEHTGSLMLDIMF